MKKKYPTYNEAKKIVAENGIETHAEYKNSYKHLGLPANPNVYYKDEWTNWPDFLGKTKLIYPTYNEAKRIVAENEIKTYAEYKDSYKHLCLPANPNVYYKDEWTNWPDFWGKTKLIYPTYNEAKKIVATNGIETPAEYKDSYKRLGLPANPYVYFKDEWISFYDFLGKTKLIYPTYNEAKKIVATNGIETHREYIDSYKRLGLPSAPNDYYKDEWTSWYDFLGKTKKLAEKTSVKVLSKFAENSILLSDDAPLQVVYMIASQIDKKLANEIEELLAVPSCEDRLSMVKEQLKNLKTDSTIISTSTHSSATDELSAMESILDILEESMEGLSSDTADYLNNIIENYYHNAINKALIEEYDG